MTSRIKANEIDALTAGAALSVNATPTFTKAGTFSDTLAVTNNLTVSKNIIASANATVAGTYTGGGLMTTGGNIIIPDAGNIGSASDTDAMAISSGGVVTFSQPPVGTITTENSGGVSVSSQTGADFTGLPAGIKRIFVNFYGCSAGSDSGALIRLGTASGFVTSGYGSLSHYGGGKAGDDSSGFFIGSTNGGNAINGTVVINHMGGNVFVTSHSVMYNSSNGVFGGGYKDLGATLTQLTVRLSSGGNYDSGLINIMYQL